METLAYLYVARDYEAPDDIEERRLRSSVAMRGNLNRVSSLVGMAALVSALVWSLLVLDNQAIAQILAPGQLLQLGSRGDQVRQLQRALNDRRYFVDVDGVYGIETQSAVRAFQQVNNLSPDGIYGIATERALFGEISPLSATGIAGFSPYQAVGAGNRILSSRDSGSDVRELQRLLRDEGYYFGDIDGRFGAETESAVRSFQLDRNLEVDGIVGQRTWNALGVSTTGDGSGTFVDLDFILNRDGNYLVVVPGNDSDDRFMIQNELGLEPYLTRSGRGSFLTPGGYDTYRAARNDVLRLRARGLDARVEHFSD